MRWWPCNAQPPTAPPGRDRAQPSTGRYRAQRGQAAERVAVAFLKANGYTIDRTNVRYPVGELDIVAREGNTLCFVEVRSKTSDQWGGPLESITLAKRRRLIRAAQWFLAGCRSQPGQMRFDVVAVRWREGRRPALELIRGAFDATHGA